MNTKNTVLPAGKEIIFKYIFDNNYNPQYATGAYGGLTPGGDIVINFFQERMALPTSVTHIIKDDSSLGPEISRQPDGNKHTYVRFITTGITLHPKVAKNIYKWLGQLIGEYETKNGPEIE